MKINYVENKNGKLLVFIDMILKKILIVQIITFLLMEE